MPQTLTEKILARAAGRGSVWPGEIVTCRVDLVCIDEIQFAIFKRTLERLGTEEIESDRIVFVVDHFCPPTNLDQARNNKLIRDFARSRGHRFLTGGIKGQIMWENGLLRPGLVLAATDSHTNTCGALGLFASAFGPSEAAIMAVRGEYWFKVPETVRVQVEGEFPPLVTAKDLGLFVIGLKGTDFANYKAVEFTGPTIRSLNMDGRVTLCNMTTEMGAKNGIVAPDETTADFLKPWGVAGWPPLAGDEEAHFAETIAVDAGKLEPLVAAPHSPRNVMPVTAAAGLKIDQGFIGSCGNGNLSDLRLAARILSGRQVHPDTRLLVAPASKETYLQALKEGLIEVFLRAGATVSGQTCSLCPGLEAPLLPGEVCLTTSPRNFKGRMGSPEALIHLASPATVAVSAIRGRIADPREFS